MKKTTIAIAILTFGLLGTAMAQEKRKAPRQVGNPFGLGGTVTAGVKNRKPTNLGDTGTHEVGHKGKRRNAQFRPNPAGDGTTEHFSKQPNAAKYDGIDGESNDARTKNPNSGASPAGIAAATEVAAKDIRKQSNKRRKTQNLLPYMEQSNLKARPRAKQFGAGNQVEAKTKAQGN